MWRGVVVQAGTTHAVVAVDRERVVASSSQPSASLCSRTAADRRVVHRPKRVAHERYVGRGAAAGLVLRVSSQQANHSTIPHYSHSFLLTASATSIPPAAPPCYTGQTSGACGHKERRKSSTRTASRSCLTQSFGQNTFSPEITEELGFLPGCVQAQRRLFRLARFATYRE